MSCEFKDKLKSYLDEKLSKDEIDKIEAHLDECKDCQKTLDELLEERTLNISLPEEEVDDDILVERIKSRKKGIRRITFYGIFGFILGLFSHQYTCDKFIITKAILALPYKLAEFGLGIFFSKNILPMGRKLDYRVTGEMGFFPFNPILEILSTFITPAIIACLGMMAVGYLISDKRVFQKKKILKFLAMSISIFIIWVIALHGMYTFTLNKIDKLEDIKDLTIFSVDKFSSSLVTVIDEEGEHGQLIEDISEAKKIGKDFYPEEREGFEIFIGFNGGGRVPVYIGKDSNEMVTLIGNKYELSDDIVRELMVIVGGVNDDRD